MDACSQWLAQEWRRGALFFFCIVDSTATLLSLWQSTFGNLQLLPPHWSSSSQTGLETHRPISMKLADRANNCNFIANKTELGRLGRETMQQNLLIQKSSLLSVHLLSYCLAVVFVPRHCLTLEQQSIDHGPRKPRPVTVVSEPAVADDARAAPRGRLYRMVAVAEGKN